MLNRETDSVGLACHFARGPVIYINRTKTVRGRSFFFRGAQIFYLYTELEELECLIIK